MEREILDILKVMQSDISNMKTNIGNMKTDIGNMKTDIGNIKTTQAEHTQILRALEHASQVNKAEHDKMQNDIDHIKGDVESIKKDLCRVEEATANNWADIAKLKSLKTCI